MINLKELERDAKEGMVFINPEEKEALQKLKEIVTEERDRLESEQEELLEKLWSDNITEEEDKRLWEIEERLEEIWLVMDYNGLLEEESEDMEEAEEIFYVVRNGEILFTGTENDCIDFIKTDLTGELEIYPEEGRIKED